MPYEDNGGKAAGKAIYAGRRRPMTRKSGFKSHPDSTGGEYRIAAADEAFQLEPGQSLLVQFDFSALPVDATGFYGCGLYWKGPESLVVTFSGVGKKYIKQFDQHSWSKAGLFWIGNATPTVSLTMVARERAGIYLYAPSAGKITHHHLNDARDVLLKNMHTFVPETIFIDSAADEASVAVDTKGCQIQADCNEGQIVLKSCNRCARYLPVNIGGPLGAYERRHLSFSNHCVAEHRRPCSHTGFGKLKNADEPEVAPLHLHYGFQLECRFCKKFEVNAAHNPQRSAAQMKEDGARRRAFELLLAELYKSSPQLRYRHKTGRELADDVYARFNGRCFKCGYSFKSKKDMHLDHTRPLALLWPLDEFATALCKDHNSEKRDRFPSDYYSEDDLQGLSKVTGITLRELQVPSPNMDAVDALKENLDWFVDDFLSRPEMMKVRDGKLQGDLLVKALEKCLAKCSGGPPFDLEREIRIRKKR
jgi:hypothetical protein